MIKLSKFFLIPMLLTLTAFSALAQRQVTGTVTDNTTYGLPGVAVLIKGTTTGVITDLDGKYAIEVPDDNAVLVFSSMGFSDFETTVGSRAVIDVVMQEDSEMLEEVVVVGMGTQKRNTITAAVATMNADEVMSRPVTDLTSALQGNIAGLNFTSDATEGGVGGELGSEIQFNIRGMGSINGGEPYVLVDGVEQSMQNVNPADIASITVLKDASASAVYGARAAYGVVLVTTKSGQSGKATVSYRGTVGFSSPINMPESMNSIEFANYVNEYRENTGQTPLFGASALDKLQGFINNPYSAEYPGIDINQAGDGWAAANEAQYANTDWFDYYFKDYSLRHSHNLSVSGGTDKVTYYVGAGYTYQGGLMDHVKDDLSKYNVNTKLEIRAKDWLKFNINNNLTVTTVSRPLANQTIFYGTIANTVPTRVTQLPVEGEYNIPNWNEIMYMRASNYRQNRVSDAMTLGVTITPIENWDIIAEMKGRLDVESNTFSMGFPKTTLPDGSVTTTTGTRQGYQYPGMTWKNTNWGSFTRGNLFNYYLSPSVSTSYTNQWGDHYFKAMAGFQAELQENSSGYTYKDGMLSEDIFSFQNANGVIYAGDTRDHWATMGFFARVNWNWRNIYFAEISGRYDGSSRFAPGHRWGVFPSASIGYDIARTDYFKALNTPFSQLKVRLSYGRLGNQNGAGLYDYIGVMTLNAAHQNAWLLPGGTSTAPAKGTIAMTPSQISPYITWEKVDNANLGIDMMLLDNRLTLTADIYQRTTRDMIGPAEAIPAIGGIAPGDRATVNNATLRNRGWELSVNWADQLRCGFSYSVGFNVFDYKAVVTEYNNPEGLIYNNHTGLSNNKGYYEGMDTGEIWGYVADDLFTSNAEINNYLKDVDLSFFKPDNQWQMGDVKYVDSNGDGKVDPGNGTLDDHGDLQIIGNATPRYSFGINLAVGYKGFQISTLLQGVAKRDFPMAGSTYLFGGKNYFKDHLDHFSTDNPNGYLPRLTNGGYSGQADLDWQVNTGYNTTRYLLNAAYMRMKNLTVSYTFSDKVLDRLKLGNLRVYVSCDNVFTIDALPSAFDPETLNIVNTWAGGSHEQAPALTSALNQNGNGKVYPLSRTFVFGLDITF